MLYFAEQSQGRLIWFNPNFKRNFTLCKATQLLGLLRKKVSRFPH